MSEENADTEGSTSKKYDTVVAISRIDIPFSDVLMLSFQGLIAGLIIVIPIAFIISLMVNS